MFGFGKKKDKEREPTKQEVFDKLKIVESGLFAHETSLRLMGENLIKLEAFATKIKSEHDNDFEVLYERIEDAKNLTPENAPFVDLIDRAEVNISVDEAKKLIEAYESKKQTKLPLVKSQPHSPLFASVSQGSGGMSEYGLRFGEMVGEVSGQPKKETLVKKTKIKLGVKPSSKEIFEVASESRLPQSPYKCGQCGKGLDEGEFFVDAENRKFCLEHIEKTGSEYYD